MVTTEQTNKQTESDNRASQLIGTWTADFRKTGNTNTTCAMQRFTLCLSAKCWCSFRISSKFLRWLTFKESNYDDDDIGEETAK